MTANHETQPDFIPADMSLVDDLETLKVLADPLRLRIRELMFEPTTVKQVAAALELPPTKLYYHINLLEKHGLIVLVDTRIVSGIIEKHYQVASRRVQVAKHLLSPSEEPDNPGLELTLNTFFGNVREDLMNAIQSGAVEWDDEGERHEGLSLYTGTMRLTPSQAAQLYADLEELLNHYNELSHQQEHQPEARYYRTLTVLFPQAGKRPLAEREDDE